MLVCVKYAAVCENVRTCVILRAIGHNNDDDEKAKCVSCWYVGCLFRFITQHSRKPQAVFVCDGGLSAEAGLIFSARNYKRVCVHTQPTREASGRRSCAQLCVSAVMPPVIFWLQQL